MKNYLLLGILLLVACNGKSPSKKSVVSENEADTKAVSLYILGTVQDGGSPHIGCKRECCAALFSNPDASRKVVSLGVVDHEKEKSYLFEATPDITSQMKSLKEFTQKETETPNGIFLTHAHIGHYTGLQYFGREALGAKQVPVYAMPQMKSFLESNGPWNQLVTLENISIQEMENEMRVQLTSNLSVIPFIVPHRDEYSETVGFKIIGPSKTALFIPDIDKWSKWEKNIIDEIKVVDYAFLDASFYDGAEINNRDISEIPHPFVVESLHLFQQLPENEKRKIHFIHFNHTNPLLNKESNQYREVIQQGYNIAGFKEKIDL
ncbi:MBL fold metallo-hydrolase [Flagellimonas hymeniacidonis]|uniref:MBL fold metallo-hydrolase n=1 Tax=Flagellimonas hymeniacidonis TaxID=2603628 RepID=A0A5C8UZX7_9FLAO|nr:MBL fold metallo-hydrolase [Flagellimonas hymeniacidonis]TXN34910.1 MBL fold metallo-hydrolase [Flagellimonas hymeniacidonis]